MKKTLIAMTLAVAAAASAFAQDRDVLVAGWDFEFTPTNYSLLPTPGVLGANYSDLYPTQSPVPGVNDGVASASRGTLYINNTNGAGNWVFTTSPTATASKNSSLSDINWNVDTRTSGVGQLGGFGGLESAALALRNTGAGGRNISFVLNTTDLLDLDYFSYRSRMQLDATAGSIDWSVNVGGNTFALDPAINVSSTLYGLSTVSLASVDWGTATSLQLIGTVVNTNTNSVLLLDNLGVYGTAIPEPSTYAAILGLVSVGIAAFRRRKSIA